ncbi:MAG: YifB family Mg chelatase-like AAA ATPase [Candidatus Omnitrophica bacterium]|nr:YifB family Mg chelatase-like AAA ATPase [Candidatus Omnitrophota bacterium]
MLAQTYSYGINALTPFLVTIEVDAAKGLPGTIIVGLPDNAVKESRERIRSALRNSGYTYGFKRITVNLSPANVRKEGPSFDLAMAIGILAATEHLDFGRDLKDYAFLGELALDGQIKPVKGVLCIAAGMKDSRFKGLIVPEANAKEAALAQTIDIYPARTLADVVWLLSDEQDRTPFRIDAQQVIRHANRYTIDFSDVKGQTHVKRGLEIAAAGAHNALMLGPPGSGKSMLAKRLPTILPDMSLEEALETTMIHSIMGLIKNKDRIKATRPFRSPHHTTSDVAIIGGGSYPKPGEVTLSHHGVLFLDELPEFRRNVLEALRQPLEDNCVTIARAAKTTCFPAQFMLICAMNPCLCGWFCDPRKKCTCTSQQIQKYMSRISGPLLDRIDIHLEVPSLRPQELMARDNVQIETSAEIKERTTRARQRQLERFNSESKKSARSDATESVNLSTFANAHMEHNQIKQFCPLSKECQNFLQEAMEQLQLSARAHDRIIKVARTIADLADYDEIVPNHIAEAIQYRCLDRGWWG